MRLTCKIFVTGLLILMLLMTGCIQEEQQDGTELGVGTLRLQITDKPGDLDILYANVTISMIQVHKSDADDEDEGADEAYENSDEYDDGFIADADGPYASEIEVDIEFLGDVTGGTEPYNWSWDFGDGTISYEQSPVHNYSTEGVYTVNLTITDNDGNGVRDWYITTATIGEDDDDDSEAG